MITPYWLDIQDICAIHGEIIAGSGGASGLLNRGALESTLSKPINLYQYGGDEVTLYDLAAFYGYGLVKNHCFVDGNTRIGLIAVYTFLSMNGIELTASEVGAVTVFEDLAASLKSQEENMEKLSNWLQEHSELIPVEL
jgi:death-on-curing protein